MLHANKSAQTQANPADQRVTPAAQSTHADPDRTTTTNMTEGGKAAAALTATFAAGVAAGWLLNTYGREKLESLFTQLKDKVKST